MINMGAILDLPSQDWFGDFSDEIRVHIIDSNRPRNLSSLFGPDQKIVVWDDGDAEGLQEQKEAWEALAYAPEDDSDEDSEASDEEEADEDLDEEDGEEDGSSPSSKRKKVSPTGSRKRQKRDVRGIILSMFYINSQLDRNLSVYRVKSASISRPLLRDIIWLVHTMVKRRQ